MVNKQGQCSMKMAITIFGFQIFNIQPPRLLIHLKNESFQNKTIYSSFRSVEFQKCNYKKSTGCWGLEVVFEVNKAKISKSFNFMTFHYRIFIVCVFEKVSKGMLVTIEKELGEYFQWLYFWNHWVPLIKMQCAIYLFDFNLKIL